MRKSCISILLIGILFCSCTKNENVYNITKNSKLLYSNNGRWQLSFVALNFVEQPLTISQRLFVKHYTSDGKFSDSDGLNGTWTLPSQDTLVENYINFSSGIAVTQKYKINTLSASQLNVTYVVSGAEITANYNAIP
ncbi:MAG: hypothetical protein WCH78_14685 [Bacteroidota bacterium]